VSNQEIASREIFKNMLGRYVQQLVTIIWPLSRKYQLVATLVEVLFFLSSLKKNF